MSAIPRISTTIPSTDSLVSLLKQAAVFGEKRHSVLIGNVANIDTPTYKTRDLDTNGFQKALESAIYARRELKAPGSTITHPYGHGNTERSDSVDNPMLAEPRNITFHDGNNRSIEHEMAELSKNMMRQSFLIEVLSSQFSQLEAVISERL